MKKLFGILALVVLVAATATSYGANAPGIKIGLNYEMTGNLGWFGQTSVNAIKLYFDPVNIKGGLLGQKVELLLDNNQSKPEEARKIALKLIQKQKVSAMIGPFSSDDSIEAALVAQANGIPLLTPTATGRDVTKAGDCVFRSCFLDSHQGEMMANYALNKLKLTTAVVIRDVSPGFFTDLTGGFKEAFKKGGGKIPLEINVSAGVGDLTNRLKSLDAEKPDFYFAALPYEESGGLVKYLRGKNILIPILGGEPWGFNGLTRLVDQSALNQIYFADHYCVDNPTQLNTAFVEKYQARYGRKPDAVAAMAYDAADLLAKAIETAGSAEPSKIKAALASIRFSGVTGNLVFDADRNPKKTGVIIAWENGVQVLKEVVEP